jgi:hypothetical protein
LKIESTKTALKIGSVASCCRKDLGIITEGGGLAIHFRGEANLLVLVLVHTGMVEESRAEN